MAIPIAFFAFRYGAPLRISTVLAPFLGTANLDGPLPKLVDILAVFATIGGISATLGFVGSQFLTGLDIIVGIPRTDLLVVVMITGLTIIFTLSVSLGVDKGVRWLSNINMGLFLVMMVLTVILGPTIYIMDISVELMGQYLTEFLAMSLFTNTGAAEPTGFVRNWTVFYIAWWFSWAPFVGLFIARISKGRTVRQVAATGVVASTGVTIPWFSAVGGTALWMQINGAVDIVSVFNEYGASGTGYPIYENLVPGLGLLFMVMFLMLVVTFFVTSADSATLALAMLTTGGKEDPSTLNRVIWGATVGAIASLLMVVGGGDALQTAAVATGGPFAVILLVAAVATTVTFLKVRPVFFSQEEIDEMGNGEIDPSTPFPADD